MPQKRISRVIDAIETRNKTNGFVAMIGGKATLVDLGSGIDDEAMMSGQVDSEALRESGMSDEQIEEAQIELENRILNAMIGDTAKAYILED